MERDHLHSDKPVGFKPAKEINCQSWELTTACGWVPLLKRSIIQSLHPLRDGEQELGSLLTSVLSDYLYCYKKSWPHHV